MTYKPVRSPRWGTQLIIWSLQILYQIKKYHQQTDCQRFCISPEKQLFCYNLPFWRFSWILTGKTKQMASGSKTCLIESLRLWDTFASLFIGNLLWKVYDRGRCVFHDRWKPIVVVLIGFPAILNENKFVLSFLNLWTY